MDSEQFKMSEMPQIDVAPLVHDQVRLLARAWNLTEGAVVERLLAEFQAGAPVGLAVAEAEAEADREVAVHAIYQGVRIDGTFDPTTYRVTVTSGPLAGRSWKSPSGAAVAVVREMNPSIRAERNGWGFWMVSETGRELQTLRAPR